MHEHYDFIQVQRTYYGYVFIPNSECFSPESILKIILLNYRPVYSFCFLTRARPRCRLPIL